MSERYREYQEDGEVIEARKATNECVIRGELELNPLGSGVRLQPKNYALAPSVTAICREGQSFHGLGQRNLPLFKISLQVQRIYRAHKRPSSRHSTYSS